MKILILNRTNKIIEIIIKKINKIQEIIECIKKISSIIPQKLSIQISFEKKMY